LNEDKATRYHRAHRAAFWIGLAVFVGAMAVLVLGGGAAALRNVIVRATGASATSPITAVLFALCLVLIAEIAAVPITIYSATVDRQYLNPDHSLARALRDQLTTAGPTAVFVALGVFLIYVTFSWWPDWWWLIAVALGVGVRTALVRHSDSSAAAPLNCRPLGEAGLRARLDALAARAGVDALDVYEWTPEEGVRGGNARLVGMGRIPRVLIAKPLLSDFTDDEIEVIVAHELAHYVHRDIRNSSVLRSALALLTAAIVAAALRVAWQPLGLVGPNDAAGLPILLVVTALVAILTQPLLNLLSRRREFRADRFALALTGRPDVFVSVLRRLADRNLAETRPSTATLWLFHSHPAVEQRIRAARALQV
jgi:STE24 endopeptidase